MIALFSMSNAIPRKIHFSKWNRRVLQIMSALYNVAIDFIREENFILENNSRLSLLCNYYLPVALSWKPRVFRLPQIFLSFLLCISPISFRSFLLRSAQERRRARTGSQPLVVTLRGLLRNERGIITSCPSLLLFVVLMHVQYGRI